MKKSKEKLWNHVLQTVSWWLGAMASEHHNAEAGWGCGWATSAGLERPVVAWSDHPWLSDQKVEKVKIVTQRLSGTRVSKGSKPFSWRKVWWLSDLFVAERPGTFQLIINSFWKKKKGYSDIFEEIRDTIETREKLLQRRLKVEAFILRDQEWCSIFVLLFIFVSLSPW